MSVEYRHRIRVVHKYTPKISLIKWGRTEIRYNNECEIPGMDSDASIPDPTSIQTYLKTFGSRIDEKPTRYESSRQFEGIFGYVWNDIRIEVVTEKITTTTTTILGEK